MASNSVLLGDVRVPRPPARTPSSVANRSHGTKAEQSDPGTPSRHQPQSASVEQLRRRAIRAEADFRDFQERVQADLRRQALELDSLGQQNEYYEKELRILRVAELTAARPSTGSGVVKPVASAQPGKARVESSLGGDGGVLVHRDPNVQSRGKGEDVDARREKLRQLEREIEEGREKLRELREDANEVRTESRRISVNIGAMVEAKDQQTDMRKQLQGLEHHLSKALVKCGNMLRANKQTRQEMDVLQTERDRFERMYDRLDQRVMELRKEMAFVMEVCNLACEERDSYLELLANLDTFAQDEAQRYKKTFDEFDVLLKDDEDAKARLRTRIRSKEAQLEVLRSERQALLTRNTTEEAELGRMRAFSVNEMNSVTEQLQKLEVDYATIMQLAETTNIEQAVLFGSKENDTNHNMFANIMAIGNDIGALEKRKEELLDALERACTGSDEQQQRQLEVEKLETQLIEEQEDERKNEWVMERYRKRLEVIMRTVERLYKELQCSSEAIVAQSGAEILNRDNVELFIASIENRLEEYLAAWAEQVGATVVSGGTNGINIVPILPVHSPVLQTALGSHAALATSTSAVSATGPIGLLKMCTQSMSGEWTNENGCFLTALKTQQQQQKPQLKSGGRWHSATTVKQMLQRMIPVEDLPRTFATDDLLNLPGDNTDGGGGDSSNTKPISVGEAKLRAEQHLKDRQRRKTRKMTQ